MKFFLIPALLLFWSWSANAQLTLTSIPTIPIGKIDSCAVPTTAGLAAMNIGTPVVNGTWDLTAVALQPTTVKYTYKSKTAGFSGATFSDSLGLDLSTAASISYSAWRNVSTGSLGAFALGEEVLKRQAKGIGAITGNAVDSFVISAQVVTYSAPVTILKLPATMSSKWKSNNVTRSLNFNLTVTMAGLNNSPGVHKQILNSVDSVVGWGKMKVPMIGKLGSTYIQVLQVRQTDVYIDSFFLNGSPASAAVLTPLGVSQGQSTTVARTLFFRAAALRPLVEGVHSGSSHSSSLSRSYIHADDLTEQAAGIGSEIPAGDITLSPNPLIGNQLQLSFEKAGTGKWKYDLMHISGQHVAQGSLQVNGTGRNTITLPENLATGLYYVQLSQAGEAESWLLTFTVQ